MPGRTIQSNSVIYRLLLLFSFGRWIPSLSVSDKVVVNRNDIRPLSGAETVCCCSGGMHACGQSDSGNSIKFDRQPVEKLIISN